MKLISVELHEEEGQHQLKLTSENATVETIDRLIEILGKYRKDTAPPVRQADPQPGEVLEIIQDPRVCLGGNLEGQVLMSVRHPGLNWLHFELTPESEAFMRQWLQARVAQQPAAPTAH